MACHNGRTKVSFDNTFHSLSFTHTTYSSRWIHPSIDLRLGRMDFILYIYLYFRTFIKYNIMIIYRVDYEQKRIQMMEKKIQK